MIPRALLVIEPFHVRREFFNAHDAICTDAAVAEAQAKIMEILTPEGDIAPSEALAASVRSVMKSMPGEIRTIDGAAVVSGRKPDDVRKELLERGAADGLFEIEDQKALSGFLCSLIPIQEAKDDPMTGRDRVWEVVKMLPREEIESIAASAFCAMYIQNADEEIVPDDDVNGADLVDSMGSIFRNCGMDPEALARGVRYKIQLKSVLGWEDLAARQDLGEGFYDTPDDALAEVENLFAVSYSQEEYRVVPETVEGVGQSEEADEERTEGGLGV